MDYLSLIKAPIADELAEFISMFHAERCSGSGTAAYGFAGS